MSEKNNGLLERWWFIGPLALASAASFGLTIWLALYKDAASAGVTMLMTFGFLFVTLLPHLEFVKILGLFETKIQRADKLLEQLQASVALFSRLFVETLTVTQKTNGLTVSEMNDRIRSIRGIAVSSGIDPAGVEKILSPFLSFMSARLFETFKKLVDSRLSDYLRLAEKESERYQDRDKRGESADESVVQDEELLRAYWEANKCKWVKINLPKPEMDNHVLRNLRALCYDYLDNYCLTDDDKAAFRRYADHIGSMGDRIWSEQEVPREVDEHFLKYKVNTAYQSKLKEMFGGKDFTWRPTHIGVKDIE